MRASKALRHSLVHLLSGQMKKPKPERAESRSGAHSWSAAEFRPSPSSAAPCWGARPNHYLQAEGGQWPPRPCPCLGGAQLLSPLPRALCPLVSLLAQDWEPQRPTKGGTHSFTCHRGPLSLGSLWQPPPGPLKRRLLLALAALTTSSLSLPHPSHTELQSPGSPDSPTQAGTWFSVQRAG